MKVKDNFFVFLVLSFFFIQFNALSQTFQSEMKALAKGADVILTGKVVQQKSDWIQNKSRIVTRTTIQVSEYLKGDRNENTVVVNHPGGEVDGVGELYTHMPEFSDNEEVLLFLKKDTKSPEYKVFSGEDGKISLIRNKDGEIITPSNISLNTLKMQIKSYTNQQ
jgi:hypothetical protein